jgi:hypothetical protein
MPRLHKYRNRNANYVLTAIGGGPPEINKNMPLFKITTDAFRSITKSSLAEIAVPKRERAWWRRLWEKILSPFPNCNAVENQPTFSRQSS